MSSMRPLPRSALRSPADLAAAGLIPPHRAHELEAVTARYALALTPAMAALIDPTDPHDPIAAQFVPDVAELASLPQELSDPIGDEAHAAAPGVVHRYPDRVLLKLLHVCPVYCRFCFRRETVGPGGASALSRESLEAAFAYIRQHPQIWEVILTGGDPLAMAARRLGEIMQALGRIAHVKIIRIHTRVPAVDPARLDDALIEALKASGKTVYVALHANHPRELTSQARSAIARIVDAGVPMVSQTVLLRGVNDDPAVLADLMRAFVENRIKPYYLHHPDLAPGTGHLRVTIARGQEIVAALRGRLSGLCQPEYVLDIPGGWGKSPIGPVYAEAGPGDEWRVRDYEGRSHAYADPPDATGSL